MIGARVHKNLIKAFMMAAPFEWSLRFAELSDELAVARPRFLLSSIYQSYTFNYSRMAQSRTWRLRVTARGWICWSRLMAGKGTDMEVSVNLRSALECASYLLSPPITLDRRLHRLDSSGRRSGAREVETPLAVSAEPQSHHGNTASGSCASATRAASHGASAAAISWTCTAMPSRERLKLGRLVSSKKLRSGAATPTG